MYYPRVQGIHILLFCYLSLYKLKHILRQTVIYQFKETSLGLLHLNP